MFNPKRRLPILIGVVLCVFFAVVPNGLTAAGEITVGVGGWAVESLEQALAEFGFTEKTGIKVNVITRPGAPPEFISQMTSAVMAGTSPYDVFNMEDEVAITLSRAGWLEPLNDLFDEEFWQDWAPDMLEMIEVWSTYNGELFRIPNNYEPQYFWYRKDIFDEHGLQPPETWEEMVEIGKILTKDGMYGVSDGLAKGAFLGVYLGYMTQQAGGCSFEFGDELRTALQFTHDMMYKHEIFPVAALNKDYDALNEDYMNDRIAMMRQWPFFYDVSRAKEGWFEEDKVVVTLPPAGPAGRISYATGWGWSIPKSAPNKEAAKEFVKWITSTELAPKLAELDVWYQNTRYSVMDAVGDQGVAKYMKMYSEAGVLGTRPFHPKFMEATTVLEDLASMY